MGKRRWSNRSVGAEIIVGKTTSTAPTGLVELQFEADVTRFSRPGETEGGALPTRTWSEPAGFPCALNSPEIV